MSERMRLTGREVLASVVATPCPLSGCDGELDRETFKGTDALVCARCGTPAVRVWGDP
jgi:hypothetical protein